MLQIHLSVCNHRLSSSSFAGTRNCNRISIYKDSISQADPRTKANSFVTIPTSSSHRSDIAENVTLHRIRFPGMIRQTPKEDFKTLHFTIRRCWLASACLLILLIPSSFETRIFYPSLLHGLLYTLRFSSRSYSTAKSTSTGQLETRKGKEKNLWKTHGRFPYVLS